MKRLNLMILIIGVAILFFGCSKNNSMSPDISQGDELTTSLKGHEIAFEGTSTPALAPDPPDEPGTTTVLPNGKILMEGLIAEWYELSEEPMVTGKSIWYINWLWEGAPFMSNGEVWGTTDIYVGLESGEDAADADGKWELIWHGWLKDGMVEVEAVGTGESGVVEGMTAHWTYTLDLSVGLIYNFTGSINSKPKTKTIKFHRSWGTFEIVDEDPYYQTLIIGEGNATLIGHFTNLNTYDSDAYGTPIGCPWLGFITAANGDEIYTQLVDMGPPYQYVIIGGTGRFEGATGDIYMEGEVYPDFSWYMEGEGTITY